MTTDQTPAATAAALKQIVSNLKRIASDLEAQKDFSTSRSVWMEADALDLLAFENEVAGQPEVLGEEFDLSAEAEDRAVAA